MAQKLGTEVRQEQIAQAALDLIAARGLKGLSVAGVARRVGLVPSAIYRHFKGKEDVLDAVLDLLRGKLLGNVRAVCDETNDPIEQLRRLLLRHVALIRENQAIPRVVFSEEVIGGRAARKAKVYGIIRSYLNKVAAIVRRGQREGQIRTDVRAATLSVMFLGLVQPPAVLWLMSGGTFNVTRHVAEAWPMFSGAIRSSSGNRKAAARGAVRGAVGKEIRRTMA